MRDLEDFLTTEYVKTKRDLEEIGKLILEVVNTFEKTYDSNKKCWPYRLERREYERPKGRSHSTTAMILLSLAHAREVIPPEKRRGKIDEQIHDAALALVSELLSMKPFATHSSTFGQNDPLTIAWLAELCNAGVHGVDMADLFVKITEYAQSKLTTGVENPKELFSKLSDREILNNAFLALRYVHILKAVSGDGYANYDTESQRRFQGFESELHSQLSFSEIPDSRFDPAELVFCLEGMLQTQRDVVDSSLLDRVVEVLEDEQRVNAFWRPVRPFEHTQQGLVLFPVSVEVANSLRRACACYDGSRLHGTYGSRCIEMFGRYYRWLKARMVRFQAANSIGQVVGWHSEHVNDPELIHLWETSQVLEFLIGYRDLLKAHNHRQTLIRSGLQFEQPGFDSKSWEEIKTIFEPVSHLGKDYLIYERIGVDFLPRTGSEDNFSMLLYGPPGTGKTSVAKNLAGAIGCRLIRVTVSDFLAGGEAEIEKRAKHIFEMLRLQPQCIVLFDEIDHFILDRDSERYEKQQTVFQFLTPGMLTKLNDLRESQNLIFIIATNYEERIDAAIKRTGRVDKSYLLLPPDAKARKKILGGLLDERDRAAIDKGWDDVLAKFAFLGYGDMKVVVKDFSRQKKRDACVLADLLEDHARTTRLEAYASRFVPGQPAPMEEFFCLVALWCEVQRSLSPSVHDVAIKALEWLQTDEFSAHSAEDRAKRGLSEEDRAKRRLSEGESKRVADALNSLVRQGGGR
jgi:hypothetical protein